MNQEPPVSDVFATQGIIAVLICIAVIALHFFAPDPCNALLAAWKHYTADSLSAAEIGEMIQKWWDTWFASIFPA